MVLYFAILSVGVTFSRVEFRILRAILQSCDNNIDVVLCYDRCVDSKDKSISVAFCSFMFNLAGTKAMRGG